MARMYTIIWCKKYDIVPIDTPNRVLSIIPIINIFYLLAVMYTVHDVEESVDKFVDKYFKLTGK